MLDIVNIKNQTWNLKINKKKMKISRTQDYIRINLNNGNLEEVHKLEDLGIAINEPLNSEIQIQKSNWTNNISFH